MVTAVPYGHPRAELEHMKRQLAELDRLDRQNYQAFTAAKRLEDHLGVEATNLGRQLSDARDKVARIREAANRYRSDMSQLRARVSALERSGTVR